MRILVFCLFTFTVLWGFSQEKEISTPKLLWEISGNKLKKPSYLFGSIHLNQPELFHFQDSLYMLFQNAEIYSPEIDVYDLFGLYAQIPLNQNLLLNNAGRIYQTDRFSRATSYRDAKGWPQIIDTYLNQIAVNSGKKVIALESVEEQFDAINNVTYFTTNYVQLSNDELVKNYLSGDILKIAQITHDALSGSNGFKEIITNRNVTMAQKIDSIVHIGSAFIAVGAAHLGGGAGLIQLLQKKGYHIRQIGGEHTTAKSVGKDFFQAHHKSWYVDSTQKFKIPFGLYPKVTQEDNHLLLESWELGQGNYYSVEIEEIRESSKVEHYLDENFYQPQNATLNKILVNGKWEGYQGIIEIDGRGLSYRRIFIKDGYLYKITCGGNVPFLNSNRPEKFLNSIEFF